jgi:nucleoside-diphosphate-sugar epimerase
VRALVTGATGFLGSNLARHLVDHGDAVRVLVRPTSDRRRLEGVDLELAEGDVTDADSVMAALDGMDVVFHTAALVEFGPHDPGRMEAVNVDGTRHVIGGATDRDILAVHVSSVAALGPTGPDPVDESWWNPEEPTVAYEATKRAAHLYVRDLARSGRRVRIGIPGGIYGFGDESSMAKLIETFVRYPTPLGYMPDLVQSLVNVDDCAEALLRIAEDGADGEEYLICADAVTFREWFQMIAAGARRRAPVAYIPTSLVRWSGGPASTLARWMGGNPEMLIETLTIATRHSSFSGDKLRRELAWTPRSLRDGMTEMAIGIQRDAERLGQERRAARERARAQRRSST